MGRIKLTPYQRKKSKKGLCVKPRCYKRRNGGNLLCSMHCSRRDHKKNPIRMVFHARKSRAKSRGIDWNLTYEEFKAFCEKTGYMEKKGTQPGCATIDRIDPSKGYQMDNIQILTLRENVRKRWETFSEGYKAEKINQAQEPQENLPF